MSTSMKSIRQRLGGSQQWWADYLSIGLSTVKLAETGHRSLPTPALLKISALELLLAHIEPTAPPPASPGAKRTSAAATKNLHNQISKMNQQAQRARQQLEKMQAQYLQASTSLLILEKLLGKTARSDEEKKDKGLLQLLQSNMNRQVELCGPPAQILLQWKIDCYTYGQARAQELAAQLTGKLI